MLIGSPGQAFGQDCDYDTCALRLQSGWRAVRLVAGSEAQEISELGLFPSRDPVPLLAERSELAASLYGDFRSQQVKGSLLYVTGLGLVVASFFYYDSDGGYTDAGWGLVIGGAVVGAVGNAMQSLASDKLSRAVWEYNGTLTR